VLDCVFLLEVDSGHIELVHADHIITEDALVHDLDHDRLLLDFALMNLTRLKEQMFPPLNGGCAIASDVILRRCVLLLPAGFHSDHWADQFVIRSFEVLASHDIDMNHIIASLH